VLEIINSPDHITICALQGNAGAGGVFHALAADRVSARNGIALNPHYKGMGNLYGSEYWTYLFAAPHRTRQGGKDRRGSPTRRHERSVPLGIVGRTLWGDPGKVRRTGQRASRAR